ncbi:uncharacterized protein LOC123305930 isoform X2 [Chrysoperla carnea]|uniref:uncharacterized protein LOC123305930 isoform X2 n=1 Tax=Chrysoperla carnea TaxID=189513 RepID=UPI001D081EFA|nr:uncharacterized protein LOC123305930 isoform X2 [Chrysoperla carnea]
MKFLLIMSVITFHFPWYISCNSPEPLQANVIESVNSATEKRTPKSPETNPPVNSSTEGTSLPLETNHLPSSPPLLDLPSSPPERETNKPSPTNRPSILPGISYLSWLTNIWSLVKSWLIKPIEAIFRLI